MNEKTKNKNSKRSDDEREYKNKLKEKQMKTLFSFLI
jgi:hypothetical protein